MPFDFRRAKGRVKHESGKMNKTEKRYELECLVPNRPDIYSSWRFESIKFRLADNTYYTPDFVVITNDGMMEVHEVKGFWQDDARVKIKVFAEMYPEFFVVAAMIRGGKWEKEIISK